MTRLFWRSPEPVAYSSVRSFESKVLPGVAVTVHRMSLARRIELARMIQNVLPGLNYSSAGTSASDHLDASIAAAEIDRIYVRWGLQRIDGLLIDGADATPSSVFELGPEALVREIVAAVRSECMLNEEERKN